jgi:hypothetical protein
MAFQVSQQQLTSSSYVEDGNYSETPSLTNEEESDNYSIQPSQAPPFTDEMVVELLKHVDTVQGALLHQEQAQRMRANKPTLYVRGMPPDETIDTDRSYNTHAPPEGVINIAEGGVTCPYIDPTYMAILYELTESHTEDNQEFQKIVFLFINSMRTLLQHRESALSFCRRISARKRF